MLFLPSTTTLLRRPHPFRSSNGRSSTNNTSKQQSSLANQDELQYSLSSIMVNLQCIFILLFYFIFLGESKRIKMILTRKLKKPFRDGETRGSLSKQSLIDYTVIRMLFNAYNGKLPSKVPGARSRFDDFSATHIIASPYVYFSVPIIYLFFSLNPPPPFIQIF